MVAISNSARPSSGGISRRRSSQPGSRALLIIPALLVLVFAWQVASPLFRTEITSRAAVGFARVNLAADPAGTRVDMVMVDRQGQDTSFDGDVSITVRDPDGGAWQATRTVGSSDFTQLPSGGLLAGRLGYSVVVPTTDWVRTPRHGGAGRVTVTVQPASGDASFSAVSDERFP